jgi:V8-like Glu-specific endopeptidase
VKQYTGARGSGTARIARLRPVGMIAAAVATAALAGACGSGTPTNQAANSKPAAASPSPKAGDVLTSINGADLSHPVEETPEQINQYWTDDRLQQAVPATPEGGGEGITARDLGLNVQVAPSTGPSNVASGVVNSSAGYAWSKVGATGRTVGRLYYTFGKANYVCSGAVVSSKSKTLVATAGHCLWNTRTGGWASNVLFIPGDTAGKAPYGRWAGARLYVPREFWRGAHEDVRTKHSYGSGWAYDHGFIRMKPLNGRNIQTALGSLGISFSGLHSQVLVLGYPTAAPFDGKTMRYCGIANMARDSRTYTDWSLACRMTPGASGGPWIANYRNGTGYVTTTSSVGNGKRLWGAFWGKNAYALYTRADANAA